MKRKSNDRWQSDLERELRSSRPQPRVDFARALADEVRDHPTPQRSRGRVGLAFALTGLIVVAIASFGGVGYASSAVSQAVKKVEPTKAKHTIRLVTKSAAQAQYAPFTPPKAKPAQEAKAAQTQASPPRKTTSQLPFTGLSLWMPFAIGLVLIAVGLVLRTRGRRRDPAPR